MIISFDDTLFSDWTERFENKRLLLDTHLFPFLNYENIQHESTKDLQSSIHCIHESLPALKVLEYEQNKFTDDLLVNMILSKVDRETRK